MLTSDQLKQRLEEFGLSLPSGNRIVKDALCEILDRLAALEGAQSQHDCGADVPKIACPECAAKIMKDLEARYGKVTRNADEESFKRLNSKCLTCGGPHLNCSAQDAVQPNKGDKS